MGHPLERFFILHAVEYLSWPLNYEADWDYAPQIQQALTLSGNALG